MRPLTERRIVTKMSRNRKTGTRLLALLLALLLFAGNIPGSTIRAEQSGEEAAGETAQPKEEAFAEASDGMRDAERRAVSEEFTEASDGLRDAEHRAAGEEPAGMLTDNAAEEGDDAYDPVSAKERENTTEKADQAIAFEIQSDEQNPYVLSYGQPFTNPAKEIPDTDAEDGLGYGSGAIIYDCSTVSGDDSVVESIDPKTGAFSFADEKTGIVCVTAYKDGDTCYNPSPEVKFYLSVVYEAVPADVEAYTLSGKKEDGNEWYTGDVTVTPAEGYLISASGSRDETANEWKQALVLDQDGVYDSQEIYLKKMTGGITGAIPIAEEIKLDKTAPSNLKIDYSEPVKEKGDVKFYQKKVEVTLTAQDTASGIESFSYYAGETDDPAQRTVVTQNQLTPGANGEYSYTFEITDPFCGDVFFMVRDAAGNETAVYTDGKTVIADKTPPKLSPVEYGKWVRATETESAADPLSDIPDYEAQSRTDVNLYYNDTAKLTFTIAEENFDAADVVLTDNGSDIAEKVKWNAGTTAGTWVGTLALEEGAHVIELHYQDASQNAGADYTSEHIIVDKTAPSNLKIDYSTPVTEKIINLISFGFYQTKAEVTLEAQDTVSGIESFSYCAGETDDPARRTTVAKSELTPEADGRYRYTFEIPDPFRGDIFFTAKDASGNEAAVYTDGKTIVVDNTPPALEPVKYGEWVRATEPADAADPLAEIPDYQAQSRTDVNLYYSDTAKLTFTVAEENFDAADVRLTDNGSDIAQAVKWNAGSTAGTWVGTLALEEGAHVIELHYEDASGNTGVDYVSEHIIVDKTAPSAAFTVSGEAAEPGTPLFIRKAGEAVISLTEANFRHKDLRISVTALDAQGNEIALTKDGVDYDAWLSEEGNWSKSGDVYSAALPCEIEAAYTFSLSAKDLADHQAEYVWYPTLDGSAPVLSSADYSGDVKSVRDAQGNEVTEDAAGARWVYADAVTLTAVITEANFLAQDVNVRVYRDGTELGNGDGYRYVAGNWQQDGADRMKHTLNLTLGEGNRDGVYQVVITYRDRAGNAMADFTSRAIVIDTTSPEIAIAYDNDVAVNGKYYSEKRTAEITVTDQNLGPNDLELLAKTVDVEGNPVSFALDKKQSGWSRKGDVWSTTLRCDTDADYTVTVNVCDAAKHAVSASDAFVVDTKKSDTDSFHIEYSESVLDKVLNKITFSYYRPKVRVRLYADDMTSGVDSMEWYYERESGAGAAHKETASGKIRRSALTFSNRGRTAMAEFTLTAEQAAQYRGNISFRVTDRAGNISNRKTDTGNVLIVDTVSPTRTVSYSPAKQVVDKKTLRTIEDYGYSAENTGAILYYDGAMQLTLEIAEANFYAEDVKAAVDEKEVEVTGWSRQGDVWTGSIPVSGEGDHIVTVEYTDRSSNEMVSYTSEQITIDKKKPVIDVSYTPDERVLETEEKRYYAQGQTAVITITERNFRAEDVEAEITAKNIAGDDIAAQDYAEYLKRPGSWVRDGDRHTARITFSSDADYTFDIGYTDLALRKADAYEKNAFVVDTGSPENLTVEYSDNVFETILGTVTFGFYQAQVTVTITAEDAISGIYRFVYSCNRSEGVSDVNAATEKKTVEENEIVYSNGDRLATATFQVPGGEVRGDRQFDGSISFAAEDRAGHSMEFEDTKRLIVDNIAPNAEIEWSEPVQTTGEIAYYSGDIEAVLTVTEANFYEEDVTVAVERDGQTIQVPEIRWTDESVDVHKGRFALSGDGDYVVSVRYEDRSGNEMEEYQSQQLTIDTESPQIAVRGITNYSANREEQIGFEVVAEDTNFDGDAFAPKLTAEVREEDGSIRTVDMTSEGRISTMGNGYVYAVSNLERDAVYTLTCEAADMAGNQISDLTADGGGSLSAVMFSVNRDGSAYTVSEETSAINGSFSNKPTDIVITEINVDALEETRVTLFKNDKTVALTEGSDYNVSAEGGDGTWYAYTYNVYKENFSEDGIYRLAVYSQDAAGNVADNTLDNKNVEISFGIDKTGPNLVVTNLESGMTYPVENLDVRMQANDNMKLVSVKAVLDGSVCAAWNEQEIDEKAREFSDYSFAVSGDQTHAHDLRIVLTDAAGNEQVEEISDFYVTTNMWVRFLHNRLLFFGTIGGVTAIAVLPAGVLLLRRRRKRMSEGLK